MSRHTPPSINLDNNATTPLHPDVAAAMFEVYRRYPGNPASQHHLGQRAQAVLEDARDGIASLLGLQISGSAPDRLIFTSGGTEANNLALRGLCRPPGHLLVSSIEHPSVLAAADKLVPLGMEVHRVAVTPAGVVDQDQLDQLVALKPRLVSIMLANNETGILQPLGKIACVCRAAGVPLHSDAVQAVGKIAVDFRRLGLSAMTVSAHKFHGPPGIGALALCPEMQLDPQQFGGAQQRGLRPGTEPVALAVGMHRALQLWHTEAEQREARLRELQAALEGALVAADEGIVIHGASIARLPQTTSVSFPGVDRQALVLALDLAGIACSTGSACSSGSSEPSPVLTAMGVEKPLIESALRFSSSALTTAAAVDAAAACILRVYRTLRDQRKDRKTAWSSRHQVAEQL